MPTRKIKTSLNTFENVIETLSSTEWTTCNNPKNLIGIIVARKPFVFTINLIVEEAAH